jgi:RNA polymerase sigma-70 factor (ECF subfamily)
MLSVRDQEEKWDPAAQLVRNYEWTVIHSLDRPLAQAALDDPESFRAIVDRHKAMVFGIGMHCFQNPSVAEDLAQDVFVELFRRLRSIESDAHLKNWLRQAMTRKCIDHARWNRTNRHSSLADVAEPATGPDASDPFLRDYLRERIRILPARRRIILILRFQEGMELEEIARALGMPVNTVKSSLNRALSVLRRRLSTWKEAARYGASRA